MHLTEQTGQPRPTVLRECWASCNNGVNVVLRKYGKGGGEADGCYCDNSSFISMLVCSFVIYSFGVSPPFSSSPLKGTTSLWKVS